MPADNNAVVVVGDGGLLSWGLAYFLRSKWQKVIIVGEEIPRESMLSAANVDVEPRRVGHYFTIQYMFSHVWFKCLHKAFGTDLPPENYEFNGLSLWANPQLYSYGLRMLFRTRESVLDELDVPHVRLHRNSRDLLSEIQTKITNPKLTTTDTFNSLYFENQSFSDQRNKLVRLKRAGLDSDVSIKVKSEAADLYPSLFSARQWIRKDIEYKFPIANISALTQSLKSFCLSKGVVNRPVSVSSFTKSDGKITHVTTSDGESIPCDAVVLAAGYDTIGLLFKAGFYGCIPPLMSVYNYGINIDDTDDMSLVPKRTFTVENGLGFLRDQNDVTITGLHTFGTPMNGVSPSYQPVESGEVYDSVVERFKIEMNRFINVRLNRSSVRSVSIDESTVTPDSLPIIGRLETEGKRLPRPSNVFMCCGLGLSGGYAALSAAKLTADISTGDKTDIPTDPYLPSRFWLCS
eukprot:TRINITY_DN1416_c3_g2_i1.p1 TRINITY_DN1416_c3_g2~~TRINITY_DN1416_c3_g2_i1.p1  ORF type:complete len:462 (+),score=51.44 TRINITY_DN1416_c3_g2_i1:61-1446(+)